MTPAAFVVALVVVVALIRSTRPEPDAPIFCWRCSARFGDQRAVAWHIAATHPADYEVTKARRAS